MRHRRAVAIGASVVGLAVLAVALVVLDDSTAYPGAWPLLPVTATMLLIVAGSAHADHPVVRLLSLSPAEPSGESPTPGTSGTGR